MSDYDNIRTNRITLSLSLSLSLSLTHTHTHTHAHTHSLGGPQVCVFEPL